MNLLKLTSKGDGNQSIIIMSKIIAAGGKQSLPKSRMNNIEAGAGKMLVALGRPMKLDWRMNSNDNNITYYLKKYNKIKK